MKIAQKSHRLALWFSLPFLMVGLVSLAFLFPRDLDEFYWSRQKSCLCDTNGGFLRFHENRLIVYNTHHRTADFSGRYEKKEDGRIYVFERSNLKEEEARTMIISPRLFGCWINYCESENSEWCWRGNRQHEIDSAVKAFPVVSYQYNDEEYVRTHFDNQFEVIRVERIPKKKPRK